MSTDDDARQGFDLSAAMMRAIARRDEAEVLRLVNEAEQGPLRWAAATMTSSLWEAILGWCGGDEAKASAALLNAAGDNLAVDSLVTRAELWANEHRKDR